MGSKMGHVGLKIEEDWGSKSSMKKRSENRVFHPLALESSLGRGPAVSLWLKPKAAPKNGGTEDWRIKGCYVFSDTPLAEGLANLVN